MADENVPLKARAFHFGTAASIPANWTRDTDFDDRFINGSATAGTNAGGNHSHTQSHLHIGNAHTHTIVGVSVTHTFTQERKRDFFGINHAALTHSHNSNG